MPNPPPQLSDDVRWPVCDCGYHCQGVTLDQRVLDAQRHALAAHGIDVSPDQILRQPKC
jgi:hypothetical protein